MATRFGVGEKWHPFKYYQNTGTISNPLMKQKREKTFNGIDADILPNQPYDRRRWDQFWVVGGTPLNTIKKKLI
ncbi:MAG: hypothetical protein H0A76_02020 [Candidatus Thiodubiliella endoseptemdiera]|uniref:Uncharacterized protein n=1 Tax=Candidatus Thiodubiliella endoseptemdiera TaxID=2738886 RepID=A0A853EZL9_9GAMM|nr:hypothetical protein [Candidatus Thiodubiliella endoseptemdiera]